MGFKRRGQITVFFILGIVIVIIFSFIFYTSSQLEKATFQKKAEDITVSLETSKEVQHYIYLCLKQSAEDTLIILGNQGGRIYDTQGGDTNTSKYTPLLVNLGNETLNLTYTLTISDLKPPISSSSYLNVPWYPEEIQNYKFLDFSAWYPIGRTKLPPLCNINGTNWKSKNQGFSDSYCENAGNPSDSADTMQIQIETYTSYLTKNCIDVNFLRDYTGYNITLGMPETRVTFGDNDIIFDTLFPIDITFSKNLTYSKILTFKKNFKTSVKLPVRLKYIVFFFKDILYNEIRYINYDFTKNYSKSDYWVYLNKTYPLEFYKLPISPEYDKSIARLKDYNSLIRGSPFVFQILIQNRIPVLNFIRTTHESNVFDIIIMENSTLSILPEGYDPDEDELKYNYSLWKETYDYEFNYTCCTNLRYSQSKPVDDCIKNKSEGGCASYDYSIKPYNWTNSDKYKLNQKHASINVTRKDLGRHIVNITVCDKQGLCDWQEVNIAVIDAIKAFARIDNLFTDINETYASIEDPFALDATKSEALMIDLVGGMFKWCDDKEFTNCLLFKDVLAIIPQNYSIENMNGNGKYFEVTGTHKLTLEISFGSQGSQDSISVNVTACLPHRSSVPSYPYNNFLGDNYPNEANPFQANHTCCAGNPANPSSTGFGTYLSSSTQCYSLTEYGTYKSFNTNHLSEIYSPKLNMSPNFVINNININGANANGANTNELTFSLSLPRNDIFKRVLSRNCDGTRGNVCNGTITDTITTHVSCSDITFGTDKRCSGPPANPVTNVSYISFAPISCVNYTGNTFESIFVNPSNSHAKVCNQTSTCSTTNSGTITKNNGKEQFVCNATCNGNQGCTKAIECFDCYSNNICNGPTSSTNRFDRNSITGTNYTGCGNGACINTSFNLQDYCYDSNKKLMKYSCNVNPKAQINAYFTTSIDCREGESSAKCEPDPSSLVGGVRERDKGSCSAGVCVNSPWRSCGNYKCDNSDRCATSCNNNNDCIDGHYCNNNICNLKLGISSNCNNNNNWCFSGKCNSTNMCDN